MTVGDHLEENIFPVYRCQIKDLKGKLLTFFAVVLSRITGDMFCPLTRVQLKHLFPKVKEIENMCITDPVDYLIGSDEAGSQPIREHKAKGGGEFYVWKNSFGRCLGGRHELVASEAGMARIRAAKKVSKEEMNEFTRSGEMVNYLPCLPTFNPGSVATPICVARDVIRQ